jgi:asparagine synthase (glutamine-hydrolysing)
MCGIAGIVRWDGRPARQDEIDAMCGALVHRGPDDEGTYVSGGVAIGMRRLSIIDLAHGQQPIANEDGSVQVVFNGEIYNYRELRRHLESRGHTLRTCSDTETIVHLYEDYGPGCVDWLRGMFAFAIWDQRQRQILIARDRLGIKPLYYVERKRELLFASEVKALLALPGVERAISWPAVSHLFSFLATPADQSIVRDVRKLEPAHVGMSRDGASFRAARYWDVQFKPNERASESELVEQLRARLEESVTLHQISDVTVGAFLSGGIDSSAVVATMARVGNQPIKTFSVGFKDAAFDELAHARQVSRECGTEHYELVLEPDVVPALEDFAWHLDEPFGDASAIPTFMVSKLAAEHVKVVLSGDGGDELFAGYDKYVVEGRERAFDRLPAPLRRMAGTLGSIMPDGMRGRRFLRHLALDGPRRYLDASTLFATDAQLRLFNPDVLAAMDGYDPSSAALRQLSHGEDWMSAAQYSDLHSYLPLDILTKVDRMTMAHSLEARPPLLDHELVEFAATIPTRYRLRPDGTTKYLFKQALRGVLPDAIIDRRKQGFAVPLDRWLRGPLAGYARDVLTSGACRQRGVFSPAYVDSLLVQQTRGRDLNLQLWTMLSFELWCRRFLDAASWGSETREWVA